MSEKISALPAATTLANTDLFVLAKDTGVGITGFDSQHITVANLASAIGPTFNLETNETFLSTTTINNLLTQISTTDIVEGDNLYFTEARGRTQVEEETATAYTLVLADGARKWKTFTNTSDIDVIIPPQADVDWEADTYIELMQGSSGTVTLVAGTGVTLDVNENLTLVLNGNKAVAAIKREGLNQWVAFGNLVPL